MSKDREIIRSERIIAEGKAAYEAGESAVSKKYPGWCADYTFWYMGWAGDRPGMYVGQKEKGA
jgi:hypothetical protein